MPEVFLDTGGLFAALVSNDSKHGAARRALAEAGRRRQRFVTTEHVIDEAATLFKARGKKHLAATLFDLTMRSQACTIAWTGQDRFCEAMTYFLAHDDHGYSFTDCVSFLVMTERGITEAFATDRHFIEAGFSALLAD
ncbi:MAG: PIN domain-containing protein [Nitrococcus sp.]|nr:PIN domain-containing protein [Nitrococcus sp.]